jgi:hypothetical protein
MNFFTEAYKKAKSFWKWYLVALNIAILFYSITGLAKFSIMMVTISIPILYYLRKDRCYPFRTLLYTIFIYLSIDSYQYFGLDLIQGLGDSAFIVIIMIILFAIILIIVFDEFESVALYIPYIFISIFIFIFIKVFNPGIDNKTERDGYQAIYLSYDNELNDKSFVIAKGVYSDTKNVFYRLKKEDGSVIDRVVDKVIKDPNLSDKAEEKCREEVVQKTHLFSFNIFAWLFGDGENLTSSSYKKADDIVKTNCILYIPEKVIIRDIVE